MNELESLQSIFKDRLFRIPDYQRGYAWTVKELKDFWEDLVNLSADKLHYTGVFTLKKIEDTIWKSWYDEGWLIEGRRYRPFYVVDGQQRLTTFVIFIQSVYQLLRSLPQNKGKRDEDIYLGAFSLKEIREQYLVVHKPPHFIIRTYKFGYEDDNPSFEFLKYRIFGAQGGGTIEETFYTLNLENAQEVFRKNLYIYHANNGISGVEKLFTKATQNLMF